QEVDQINRREDAEGQQRTKKQFLGAARVFQRVAVNRCAVPDVTADIRPQPEPIEAYSNEFKQRAAQNQAAELWTEILENNGCGTRRRNRSRLNRRSNLVHDPPLSLAHAYRSKACNYKSGNDSRLGDVPSRLLNA